MNDLEKRLKSLKPKVNRSIGARASRPPGDDFVRARRPRSNYLLACACSFLLGLVVMYGVMRPVSQEPQALPQPVEIEEKPSRFTDDAVAVRPKEAPSPVPKVLAGESYTYLSLLRKYQTP